MRNTISELRLFIEIFDVPNYNERFNKNNKTWTFIFNNLGMWLRGRLQDHQKWNRDVSINLDDDDIQTLVNKYRPILAEMECEDNLARIKQIESNIKGAQEEIEKRKANICT
jgi:hypothetical protein